MGDLMYHKYMLRCVAPRIKKSEKGGASLETVLIAPIFVMFLALLLAGASLAIGKQSVSTATNAAARAASLASSPKQASIQAESAFNASLQGSGRKCTHSKVAVDTSAFSRKIGQTAQLKVTVTCTITYAQLTKIPGLNYSKTITETATSPLDAYKELK